jgi:hypothetical protein
MCSGATLLVTEVNRFWSEHLAGVTALPVRLAGKWSVTSTRRLQGGEAITRRWHGLATANQGLVALGVLVNGDVVQWGKSEVRPSADACEVELALFPHDNVGLEVQVNIVVGGGGYRRDTTRVASLTYLPEIPDRQDLTCGQLLRLASIKGDPVIEVGLVFLPRAAVKKIRAGNWKPRESSSKARVLSRMLSGPRAGAANLGTSSLSNKSTTSP